MLRGEKTLLDLFQLNSSDLRKEQLYNDTDMAIVGVSIHLPLVDSLDDLYHVLAKKLNCIGILSEMRKRDVEAYLKSRGIKQFSFKKAGFLDRIDLFSADFFHITPYEARLMNPNQRMTLMSAYEAAEDAGYGGRKLENTNTGVFIGYIELDSSKYKEAIFEQYSKDDVNVSVTGNLNSMIPARISYFLDLKGPSSLIDTACSSSLVALHQACNAIRAGDCEQAIVSAIQISCFPYNNGIKLGMESDEECANVFDESAAGTVRGEGSISFFIKPAKKAEEAGDYIYAVIKGSAVNQDGTTMGITAPSAKAQADVIKASWRNSKINPENLDFIEAHGTGTEIGDVIEIEGITTAFSNYTDRKQFCAVSSVKSNFGHLFDASGLLGICKCLAEFKYQKLLPGTNFRVPNKKIKFEESPLYVCEEVKEFDDLNKRHLCGVSSFGFSGTNCHVILEEGRKVDGNGVSKYHILALSAVDNQQLLELVERYQKFLRAIPDYLMDNMCYTANCFRTQEKEKIAFIFHNKEELEQQLFAVLKSGCSRNLFCSNCEITVKERLCIKNFLSGRQVDWFSLYDKEMKKVPVPLTPRKKARYWPEFSRGTLIQKEDTKVEKKQLPKQVEYGDVLVNIQEVVEKLLGISELSVTDNLISMSVDSILLARIQKEIDKIYPDVLPLSKMFVYSSIAELSNYITGQINKKQKNAEEPFEMKDVCDIQMVIDEFLSRNDDLEDSLEMEPGEDEELSVGELLDKISKL